MTAARPDSDGDELAPVDFLAIEFPGGRLTAGGFEQLLSLVDRGVVDILDMEFIAKDADGNAGTCRRSWTGSSRLAHSCRPSSRTRASGRKRP